jgi:hypothetical protein
LRLLPQLPVDGIFSVGFQEAVSGDKALHPAIVNVLHEAPRIVGRILRNSFSDF